MTSGVEELLSISEACQRLHISKSKLYRYVRAKELRAVRLGRRTLFRAAALQAFIERNETDVHRGNVRQIFPTEAEE